MLVISIMLPSKFCRKDSIMWPKLLNSFDLLKKYQLEAFRAELQYQRCWLKFCAKYKV